MQSSTSSNSFCAVAPTSASSPDDTSSTGNALPTMERPKRMLNAYNLFFRHERQRILNETEKTNPKTKKGHGKISFADLGRAVGAKWKRLTPAEKAHFEDLAAQDKIRYERQMQAWRAACSSSTLTTVSSSSAEGTEQQTPAGNKLNSITLAISSKKLTSMMEPLVLPPKNKKSSKKTTTASPPATPPVEPVLSAKLINFINTSPSTTDLPSSCLWGNGLLCDPLSLASSAAHRLNELRPITGSLPIQDQQAGGFPPIDAASNSAKRHILANLLQQADSLASVGVSNFLGDENDAVLLQQEPRPLQHQSTRFLGPLTPPLTTTTSTTTTIVGNNSSYLLDQEFLQILNQEMGEDARNDFLQLFPAAGV